MGTAIKHPVPDRVKPSFVIFDIWALWNSERPDVKNYKWRLNQVWHRMLYMATAGIKGLKFVRRVWVRGLSQSPGARNFMHRIWWAGVWVSGGGEESLLLCHPPPISFYEYLLPQGMT